VDEGETAAAVTRVRRWCPPLAVVHDGDGDPVLRAARVQLDVAAAVLAVAVLDAVGQHLVAAQHDRLHRVGVETLLGRPPGDQSPHRAQATFRENPVEEEFPLDRLSLAAVAHINSSPLAGAVYPHRDAPHVSGS
jgi:hypothetical protein